jgi:transposase
VLEDYVQAVEAAQARRDRLTAQIEAMLADWTLAPVVAALQTMRGMALVNAATLIAELGDLSRFANPRQLMAYLGHQARRPHQGRQQRGTAAADRSVLDLPFPGSGQPRAAAASRRARRHRRRRADARFARRRLHHRPNHHR